MGLGRSAAAAAEGNDRNEKNETRMIEILEFSSHYGHISHGRDALQRVYEQKKRKYANLASELRRLRREQVRVTALILSSTDAIYGRSLKDLQKVLKCKNARMRKLRRKMSETVSVRSTVSEGLRSVIRSTPVAKSGGVAKFEAFWIISLGSNAFSTRQDDRP
jgi:predicted RNase H-like nuclease (RuvC/YqgF family)